MTISEPPPPETVSTPNRPTGPSSGETDEPLTYSTGGSSSNLGHSVEYQFDWGDGEQSSWGSASRSHSWSSAGTKCVKARARCQSHTGVVSGWSSCKNVTISEPPVVKTIDCVSDTYIAESNPDGTFCWSDYMVVRHFVDGGDAWTYINFGDITDEIPSDAQVIEAILWVEVVDLWNAETDEWCMYFCRAGGDWTACEISWSSRTGYGLPTYPLNPPTETGEVGYIVTDLVQDIIDHGYDYGLQVMPCDGAQPDEDRRIYFKSKDGGYVTTLRITYVQ